MRHFLSALCLCVSVISCLPPQAKAAETAPAKNAVVPFREDSGLITAEYYLATGKYTQSLQVLGGVLNRHPQNADAYTYRGYAYQQLGDLPKAAENYRKALLINPKHLGALKYTGDLYLQDGKLEQAMEQMMAIRSICGDLSCEELDELQASINKRLSAKP